MLEEYIYHGTKKLRCGYTTGSCAAAAAKAAAKMLISGELVNKISLDTPKGIILTLDVLESSIENEYAICAVQKDSGDDPDITNGILVYAKCERIPFGIEIDGGVGVGRVTKKGLNQPVGAAAINSVPRQMITNAVSEMCEMYDYHEGIKVTIYIPKGVELASKTFNPRLGIIGGLSVIGTTGIVEPMSNSALVETIRTEEKVLRAQNVKYLLLTIGNYSKSFLADKLPNVLDKSVMCSNFIGDAVEIALELGFEGVLIVGHIGKLVKLGAGIMNTHSSQADGRMDVLVTCGVLADVDVNILKRLPDCATVDAALYELDKVGKIDDVARVLMQRTQHYLDAKVKGEINIAAVMFSDKYGIIGKTKTADELLLKISSNNYTQNLKYLSQ